jgi:hypothetical protein
VVFCGLIPIPSPEAALFIIFYLHSHLIVVILPLCGALRAWSLIFCGPQKTARAKKREGQRGHPRSAPFPCFTSLFQGTRRRWFLAASPRQTGSSPQACQAAFGCPPARLARVPAARGQISPENDLPPSCAIMAHRTRKTNPQRMARKNKRIVANRAESCLIVPKKKIFSCLCAIMAHAKSRLFSHHQNASQTDPNPEESRPRSVHEPAVR